tara:strand:+ start:862 stop:1386 length:525 start_codon:yes stop_codon:yes gene_type:complete
MPVIINGTSGDISASSLTGVSTGKILQVLQVVKSDAFSSSSNDTDITGLSVNITPSSSSNKILVMAYVTCMGGNLPTGLKLNGTANGDILLPSNSDAGSRQKRSGSEAYESRNDTNTMQSLVFLDSPNTTNQQTYKVKIVTGGATINVNRTNVDSDSSSYTRGCSTITVMEVAA